MYAKRLIIGVELNIYFSKKKKKNGLEKCACTGLKYENVCQAITGKINLKPRIGSDKEDRCFLI